MANTTIPSELIADGAITSAKLDTNIAVGGTLTVTGDANFDSNTLFVDASANAVGIGTSTPSGKLDVVGDIKTSGEYVINSGTTAKWTIGQSSDDLYFYSVSSGSERLRINSSGSVLVGKTVTDLDLAGSALFNTGQAYHTRSGDTALYLNRLSSDGTIIDLRKNGTAVGSIGTFGGTTYYASNTHGFLINGTQIEPSNNTGGRLDNTVDIGSPTYRFKNLILSGGVYLGGTGAANKLDDYEEGTWTPSFSTGTWANVANFTYTKIGRLVHVTGYLATPSNLPNGNLIISGFPFPANANYNMFPLWYAGSASTIAYAYMGNNETSITVRPVNGGVDTMSELSVQMVYTTT